jgi:hypothetical protein
MIKSEHKALAAALVDKLQNMELHGVKEHYEATRDAVYELSNAMYCQYHVDALPAIADLFCKLFDAKRNVCGCFFAQFFKDIFDEEGEEIDCEEVDSWEEATHACIFTQEVNCLRCHGFVWAETFASYVARCIERCINGWEYSNSDTDHDIDYQNFRYSK